MTDKNAWFESQIAQRACLLTEEEQLAGDSLISLETSQGEAETQALSFIHDNFAFFLKYLRYLKPEDQDLLLTYYTLFKTQVQMAKIFLYTQTVCSFRIRMAVKVLCSFILMGPPTVEKSSEIFTRAGLEHSIPRRPDLALSTVLMAYIKERSFQRVANLFNLHTPDVRRSLSRASLAMLEETRDPEVTALGAYIHTLLDKTGMKARLKTIQKSFEIQDGKIIGRKDLKFSDPDVLGEFRVKVDDPGFNQVFASKGQ